MKLCCEEWKHFRELVKDDKFNYCPYCRLPFNKKPGCFPLWSAYEEAELMEHWKTEPVKKLATRFPHRTLESIRHKIKYLRSQRDG